MTYSKKIIGPIILLAISLLMIAGMSYVFARFIPFIATLISIVISPLLGYALTYNGTKNNNKLLMVASIVFYSLFVSSVIGTIYSVKKIPINLSEFCYLSLISLILISIIYFLITKCKNVVISAFIGILLVLIAIVIVWKTSVFSLISEQSLLYGTAMLILVVFHYIIVLVATKKDIDIIKATTNGYGAIFWLIAAFATEGVSVLPTSSDKKDN